MQIYLVGGAVRDTLLGLPIKERDWVVVGATPDEMIRQGFKPVGKEFPVFLHPKTKEEYALARTERKVAKGYKGFSFYASPDVSLEQDLLRRDLTINAIAMDDDDNLIDPYNGAKDIKNKLFRHVSDAFAEDPVRILRLARLSCRFPNFTIADETLTLMQQMVKAGEVEALVAERVWAELKRALQYKKFLNFFTVLKSAHALPILFPQINLEDSTRILNKCENLSLKPSIKLAIILHLIQPAEIKSLVNRYRIPNEYADLALLLNQHGKTYESLALDDAAAILDFLHRADALRRQPRFEDFIQATTLCYPITEKHSQFILNALKTIRNIDTSSLQQSGLKGIEFAKALQTLRLNALKQFIQH